MKDLPAWLADRLRVAETPRKASEGLLFHGTVEPFNGPLVASSWEGLRWFAETPEVAQSYCPESGSEVLTSFPNYGLDDHFIPHGDFHAKIFTAMGHDIDNMEAERDHTGRMTSYRLVANHPTNRQARAFLEELGYRFEGESAWIKVQMTAGAGDQIMPAAWKIPGRLFIAERPEGLRLYDLASSAEGGLTGRQWMRTDLFEQLKATGQWDGIIIDDIHQTKKMGHFGHRSIGLFAPVLKTLRTHMIACVNADPSNSWNCTKGKTTPEFDDLHRAAANLPIAA